MHLPHSLVGYAWLVYARHISLQPIPLLQWLRQVEGSTGRMTTSVCRFCLEDTWGETLYPCRCKAPVHRRCLDSWRAAGMNPANMTRCEVCHYHYRFAEGTRTWHIHLLLYSFFVCLIDLNCVKAYANLCLWGRGW